MKYIRTTDGIYTDKQYELKKLIEKNGECFVTIKEKQILKQANTIEELMIIGDLVRTKRGDMYEITNQTYIYYYSKYKSISKLFIKDSKGNYIKVAEENDKGELELL